MIFFKLFGLCVASDYNLAFMNRIDVATSYDVLIHQDELNLPENGFRQEDLEKEFGCYYTYEKMWGCIRFPNQGDFIIQNGNEINYELKDGYNKNYIDQVFLCFCMTVLLIQRGSVLIHGSALELKKQALIISGDSGAGKSTLTEELLKYTGYYITDDVVCVNTENDIVAEPSFPLRKLCPDAAEQMGYSEDKLMLIPDPEREKYALYQPETFCQGSKKLGGMVIIKIGMSDQVGLKEITGSEKIKYLTENLFRQDVYQFIGMQKEQFMKCIKIANEMPIYVLYRPEGKMTVEEQARLVMEAMEK